MAKGGARRNVWHMLLLIALAVAVAAGQMDDREAGASDDDQFCRIAWRDIVEPTIMTECPKTCGPFPTCVVFGDTMRALCSDETCHYLPSCAYKCIYPFTSSNGAWGVTFFDSHMGLGSFVLSEHPFAILNASIIHRFGAMHFPEDVKTITIMANEDPVNNTFYDKRKRFAQLEYPEELFDERVQNQVVFLRFDNVNVPKQLLHRFPVFQGLTDLILDNNGMTEVPFFAAHLPSLKVLVMTSGSIGHVPSTTLPLSLRELYLVDLGLSESPKDIADMAYLERLSMNYNSLTSLPVGSLPSSLKFLSLINNSLSDIPQDISNMKSLEELNLFQNPLRRVDLNNLPSSLNRLSLMNCELTEAPNLRRLSALSDLELSHNNLRSIDASFLPGSLRNLWLINCGLTDFPSHTTNLQNLSQLVLNHNALSLSASQELPASLENLFLYSCGLKTVPQSVASIKNLKTLNLGMNAIERFQPGDFPPHLQTLLIGGVPLRRVPSTSLPLTLQELGIQFAALSDIPMDVQHMQNLRGLYLQHNNLTTFKLEKEMEKLEYLSLNFNQFEQFDCFIPRMNRLHIAHNHLRHFVVRKADQLVDLDLSANELEAFPPSLFHLNRLKNLNITRNRFRNITLSQHQFNFLNRLTSLEVDYEAFASDNCESRRLLRGYISVCIASTSVDGLSHNPDDRTLPSTTEPSAAANTPKTSWIALSLLTTLLVLAIVGLVLVVLDLRVRVQKANALLEGMEQKRHALWDDDDLRAHWIDATLFQIEPKLLGCGAFGQVWLGTLRHEHVAVKRLRDDVAVEVKNVERFAEEIKLMTKLSHANVVTLKAVSWTTEKDLCMLTEYMPGGDLRRYLSRLQQKEEQQPGQVRWTSCMLSIAADVANALVYLHSLDPIVIHRDLKSANVLLDSEYVAKLSDFGCSRCIDGIQTMTAGVGTLRWIAPEVIKGEAYNAAADVYSFGVILSEMDTRRLPYSGLQDDEGNELSEVALCGLLATGKAALTFLPDCPSDLHKLAMKCTRPDPRERPEATAVFHTLKLLLSAQRESQSMGEDVDEL